VEITRQSLEATIVSQIKSLGHCKAIEWTSSFDGYINLIKAVLVLKYTAISLRIYCLPPFHRAESSIIAMLSTPAAMIPDPTSTPLPALLLEAVADTFLQPDEALAGGAVMLADKVRSAHCHDVHFNTHSY
jgi:hypothetical protein